MKKDNINEQEALRFSKELISLYFEKRDMDTLLSYMDENTSWIGTGEGELCQNILEAKTALSAELAEYNKNFIMEEIQLYFVPLSSSSGIVYGLLRALPIDQSLSDENIRFTAVIEQYEKGLKLIHIHFSHADIEQEKGGFFVRQEGHKNAESLRTELKIRERQLANITKNIPGGVHQCANDTNLTILSMSDGFLSMFGYSKEDIETQFDSKFINMIYPSDQAMVLSTMYSQLEDGTDLELEYRVMQKNGQPLWILDKARVMDDGKGEMCFYCLLMDVTERKKQEEELRLSLERHNVIIDQATDIIFEWDIIKDTIDFSPNWKIRFGYDAIDTNISKRIPLSENIHPDDMPAFFKIMSDTVAGIPYSEAEFRIRNIAGRYFWSRIRATTQYNDDGQPIKAVGVIVDIDKEKIQKQELMQRAQYDVLTGIYNKATINALVEQRMRLEYTPRNGLPKFHTLMIVDVDFFKAVNDNYGHLCGDSVLSDVAEALKGCVRSDDYVGRIGGDEFLVYLPEVKEEDFVQKKAEQLMQAVSCIKPQAGAQPITCSIGVAVLPRSQHDYEVLYQAADNALYHQKNNGRNGFTIYDSQMEDISPYRSRTAVGNSIVSDEGYVLDESLAQYAFRTLYEAKDIEATLDRLLEIIGRSFDVSRAYIFENSKDKLYCSNTFEWCGEGVTPQKDSLQSISYMELHNYQKNFNERGIFYCHDVENLPASVYEILKPQGIRSMLQCAMLDDGEFVGYVGFDECRDHCEWNDRQIASFKLTADVLSTFLVKLRIKEKSKNQS